MQFTTKVLGFISNRYSREAGLRNFERNIAALSASARRKKADGEEGAWIVDIAWSRHTWDPTYTLEDAETGAGDRRGNGPMHGRDRGDLMVI